MKNTETQKRLDKQKWYASEKAGQDMCGKLPHCKFCKYETCNTVCASAYNRMNEARRK